MARVLTELQEKFLNALFGEAQGNVKLAAEMAGYSPYMYNKVVAALREEILERAEFELALNAAKAVNRITSTMEDDEAVKPGANTKMAAAKEVLDRIGLAKKDRLQIEGDTGSAIFILPPKQPVQNDDPETNTSK
jgi:hypothetical protein